MNIHEVTFKRMSFSKMLWILSFNILFMQNLSAGDIEQILPADSNFTIDGDGAAEVMRVQSDGKVGIGTTTPGERLEVNGSIRMTDGNEAANTVMVGDANGTASWADISTIQDGTGTDDQNLQDFNLTGTTLKLTIENGNTVTVDLASLNNSGSDDQQLQTFALSGSNLSLTLEDGGTVTADLSDLNDSASIAAVQSALQAHIAADEDTNATNEIQDISTDGTAGNIALSSSSTLTLNVNDADANSTNELQDLSLTGTTLSISNGNDIDLNDTFATNDELAVIAGNETDDQKIDTFTLAGTTLNLSIEDDGEADKTIDLNNTFATDVELATIAGNETDDQNIEDLSLDAATNILTVGIEDGANQTVDLSSLEESAAIAAVQTNLDTHIAADEDTNATNEIQDISTDGTAGNIALSSGSTLTLNVNDADANASNELLTGGTLNGTNLELTDAGGTTTIDLSALNNSGTDDQVISSAVEVANQSVKVTLENGGDTVINIQDDDHNSTNEIQTLTSTDGTVVLTQTGNNYDLSVVPIPYIKDTSIIVPVSTTETIRLNGYNFIPTSTVTIPGFDGTINSVQAISPLQIELNITTGSIHTFNLVVSNNGVLNTQWPGNGTGVLHVVDHSGQTKAAAGESCKHILNDGFSTGDGTYWINPDGGSTDNAFQVYCDMTTDGGGWTRIEYAADFAHASHFSGRDSDRWLDTNFTLVLTDEQINAIRAVSTEGKQRYHGTCEGVIHHYFNGGNNYSYAFGFRYHTGFETAYDQQTYPDTNITVTDDNCSANDNVLRSTDFDIVDVRVPVINVHSKDNGDSGEKFGSPLTSHPAWLR